MLPARSLARLVAPLSGAKPLAAISARVACLRSSSALLRAAAVEVSSANISRRKDERGFIMNEDGTYDLSAPPPFSMAELRASIPNHLWEKNTLRSLAYLALDVGVVAALAIGFTALNTWWAWPVYWFMQGTMFWSLFVVGHDCGHQSFSKSRHVNDLIGNITHSSILVPYHGWRISHRTHHANHGHADNDESWLPLKKSDFEGEEGLSGAIGIGRLSLPWSMLAFPFYLWKRTPGKDGSHYDPNSDLFLPTERKMILTSNAFMIGFLGILAAAAYTLGVPALMNLYLMPYLVFVVWLDAVTYLHHHGPSDQNMKMPWYREEEWSYFRGGLSTIDRDFGIFNKIHHNIETHVVHHLFSQMPHYNLVEATEAAKKVMGPYYREPEKSKGWFPTHLIASLTSSFQNDHYVEETGNIVYYKKDEKYSQRVNGPAP